MVCCFSSDGSQMEGNTSEAARMAVAQKLAVKLFVAGCQSRDVFDLACLEMRTLLVFGVFDVCVWYLRAFVSSLLGIHLGVIYCRWPYTTSELHHVSSMRLLKREGSSLVSLRQDRRQWHNHCGTSFVLHERIWRRQVSRCGWFEEVLGAVCPSDPHHMTKIYTDCKQIQKTTVFRQCGMLPCSTGRSSKLSRILRSFSEMDSELRVKSVIPQTSGQTLRGHGLSTEDVNGEDLDALFASMCRAVPRHAEANQILIGPHKEMKNDKDKVWCNVTNDNKLRCSWRIWRLVPLELLRMVLPDLCCLMTSHDSRQFVIEGWGKIWKWGVQKRHDGEVRRTVPCL